MYQLGHQMPEDLLAVCVPPAARNIRSKSDQQELTDFTLDPFSSSDPKTLLDSCDVDPISNSRRLYESDIDSKLPENFKSNNCVRSNDSHECDAPLQLMSIKEGQYASERPIDEIETAVREFNDLENSENFKREDYVQLNDSREYGAPIQSMSIKEGQYASERPIDGIETAEQKFNDLELSNQERDYISLLANRSERNTKESCLDPDLKSLRDGGDLASKTGISNEKYDQGNKGLECTLKKDCASLPLAGNKSNEESPLKLKQGSASLPPFTNRPATEDNTTSKNDATSLPPGIIEPVQEDNPVLKQGSASLPPFTNRPATEDNTTSKNDATSLPPGIIEPVQEDNAVLKQGSASQPSVETKAIKEGSSLSAPQEKIGSQEDTELLPPFAIKHSKKDNSTLKTYSASMPPVLSKPTQDDNSVPEKGNLLLIEDMDSILNHSFLPAGKINVKDEVPKAEKDRLAIPGVITGQDPDIDKESNISNHGDDIDSSETHGHESGFWDKYYADPSRRGEPHGEKKNTSKSTFSTPQTSTIPNTEIKLDHESKLKF